MPKTKLKTMARVRSSRFVRRRLWTWKLVAEELYIQGRRMRARLENLGHYSEGWDVVASFAAKKLGKTKPPNE